MINIISFLFMSSVISFILMTLSFSLSKSSFKDREKLTPFECGFTPMKKTRMPFSLRFFMVTVLFLIFDVEIVLILPLSLIISLTLFIHMLTVMLIVMFILILGLFHEWNQGILKWID